MGWANGTSAKKQKEGEGAREVERAVRETLEAFAAKEIIKF